MVDALLLDRSMGDAVPTVLLTESNPDQSIAVPHTLLQFLHQCPSWDHSQPDAMGALVWPILTLSVLNHSLHNVTLLIIVWQGKEGLKMWSGPSSSCI